MSVVSKAQKGAQMIKMGEKTKEKERQKGVSSAGVNVALAEATTSKTQWIKRKLSETFRKNKQFNAANDAANVIEFNVPSTSYAPKETHRRSQSDAAGLPQATQSSSTTRPPRIAMDNTEMSDAESMSSAQSTHSPRREKKMDVREERIALFPGWAVKRADDSISIFVSGWCTAIRSWDQATRPQKLFIKMAKGFAALPKIPTSDALEVNVPDLASSPPSSRRSTRMSMDRSYSEYGRRKSSLPSLRKSIPDLKDSDVAVNYSAAEIKMFQDNLDSRLQPFCSSPLAARTVRIVVSLEDEAIHTQDVLCNAYGYFTERLEVSCKGTGPGTLEPEFDAIGSIQVEAELLAPLTHVKRASITAGLTSAVFSALNVSTSSFKAREREVSISSRISTSRRDSVKEMDIHMEDNALAASGIADESSRPTSEFIFPARPGSSLSQYSLGTARVRENSYIAPKDTLSIPVTRHGGVRVISDLDDTVKNTGITTGLRTVFHNVFVKPVNDIAIHDMAHWYRKMSDQGVSGFHYCSNGPFQLLATVKQFLAAANLPVGSIRLKFYGGSTLFQSLWQPAAVRKRAGVTDILDQFPDSRFILVGDSGEQDMELYTAIAAERPAQVAAIFIRDVSTATFTIDRRSSRGRLRRSMSSPVPPSPIVLGFDPDAPPVPIIADAPFVAEPADLSDVLGSPDVSTDSIAPQEPSIDLDNFSKDTHVNLRDVARIEAIADEAMSQGKKAQIFEARVKKASALVPPSVIFKLFKHATECEQYTTQLLATHNKT